MGGNWFCLRLLRIELVAVPTVRSDVDDFRLRLFVALGSCLLIEVFLPSELVCEKFLCVPFVLAGWGNVPDSSTDGLDAGVDLPGSGKWLRLGSSAAMLS